MFDVEALTIPEFSRIHFAQPWFFLLGLLLPALTFWYLFKGRNMKPELRISGLAGFRQTRRSAVVRLLHLPFVFRMLSLAFITVALARPQTNLSWQDLSTEGIDIVLTMDLSPSMLARDLKPNRLEAAKNVAMDFISNRPNDRMGLVIFSGEAYTQCPLTIDHTILKNLLMSVDPDLLPEGTAIGTGLATAVNRLRESKAASKVVILITDGENNAGNISPLTAAEMAQQYGIRVYTIGVGTRGMALSPVYRYPDGRFAFDYAEVRIDEALMKQISEMTQARYFRATNNEGLKEVYQKIDEMEKTRFDSTEFRRKKEEFWPFAALALFFFLLEWFMRNTLMRSIP